MIRSHIRQPAIALALGLALQVPAAGWAHHSFAMFDKSKVVSVQGGPIRTSSCLSRVRSLLGSPPNMPSNAQA